MISRRNLLLGSAVGLGTGLVATSLGLRAQDHSNHHHHSMDHSAHQSPKKSSVSTKNIPAVSTKKTELTHARL